MWTIGNEVLTAIGDTSALCPEKVEYRIVATNLSDLGGEAIGNVKTIVVDTLPSLRKAVNIELATVLEDESILIQWKPLELESHLIKQFELHKMVEQRPTVIYELNPLQTDFIDYETDVQAEFAAYHIEIHNACQILPLKGSSGSSILLQKTQDGFEVELKWNDYDQWEKGVKEYQIQRLNEYGEWEIIKRVSPDENSVKLDITE